MMRTALGLDIIMGFHLALSLNNSMSYFTRAMKKLKLNANLLYIVIYKLARERTMMKKGFLKI